MKQRNCPNCAAPYDIGLNTCPYCGTSYFDMSCLDFENNKPFFLKIKTEIGGQMAYITQKVIPNLNGIEITNDTTDIMDARGYVVLKVMNNRSVTTDIEFTAIPNNGSLFEVQLCDN